jgi:hypothetical protein
MVSKVVGYMISVASILALYYFQIRTIISYVTFPGAFFIMKRQQEFQLAKKMAN